MVMEPLTPEGAFALPRKQGREPLLVSWSQAIVEFELEQTQAVCNIEQSAFKQTA
jgi:hypothetical protein